MPLKPMTIQTMRSLRAEYGEKKRIDRIEEIIAQVYGNTVRTATMSNETSYNYPLSSSTRSYDKFYPENMPEIIKKLKCLFPECIVKHTLMARDHNGKLHDISDLNDDVLPFVNRTLDRSYIVIDWSKK